jgi:hypothetical protein
MILFGSHWKEGDLVLKKATEYGAVEIWMNERVRRACANSCADFVYGFLEVRIFGVSLSYLFGEIEGVLSLIIYHFSLLATKTDIVIYYLQRSTKKTPEYWLIWRFEGDATLADLLQSRDFPYNVGSLFN